MKSSKYKPIEWDDDQEYCVLACLEAIRNDSIDKAEIEGCIEWINQIIEPLEYVKERDDVPFEEKRKLSHLEQLLSILERMLDELNTPHE